MGSPISVAIAEITMQKIEQLIFNNLPCDITVCMRYVDEVLPVIPKDNNESLLQHLNSQNEHIQFTIERETHRSLPFLDLLINRKDNG